MARPQKEGLEYFPIVTSFDEKIELIVAEFGPEGLGIIIGLFQRIYSNSYYMNWNEDTLLLFCSKHINAEKTKVNAVLIKCLERNIFNKDLYEQYGILTSSGIQKQYLKVCKDSRRKSVQFIQEYCLIKQNNELFNVITELTSINAGITPENDVMSTQSKEKESKEKKSKEKKTTTVDGDINAEITPSNDEHGTDPDPFVEVLNYYCMKAAVLEINLKPKEYETARLLVAEIPVSVIKKGIDEAFTNYKPKFDGDKIKSFNYCRDIIKALWEKEKIKEANIVGDNRGYPESKNNSSEGVEYDFSKYGGK